MTSMHIDSLLYLRESRNQYSVQTKVMIID